MLSAGKVITLRLFITPGIASTARLDAAMDRSARSAEARISRYEDTEFTPSARLASMASGKKGRPRVGAKQGGRSWVGRRPGDTRWVGKPGGSSGGGGDDGDDDTTETRATALMARFASGISGEDSVSNPMVELVSFVEHLEAGGRENVLNELMKVTTNPRYDERVEALRWAVPAMAGGLPEQRRDEFRQSLIRVVSSAKWLKSPSLVLWKVLMEIRFKDLVKSGSGEIDKGLRIVEGMVADPIMHTGNHIIPLNTAMSVYRDLLLMEPGPVDIRMAERLNSISEWERSNAEFSERGLAMIRSAITEALRRRGNAGLITKFIFTARELARAGDETEVDMFLAIMNEVRRCSRSLVRAARAGVLIHTAHELRDVITRNSQIFEDREGKALANAIAYVFQQLPGANRETEIRAVHAIYRASDGANARQRFAEKLFHRLLDTPGQFQDLLYRSEKRHGQRGRKRR